MPPFWIVKSLMCSEREGSRYVIDIENHIWKWYERVRLKSLVCSLVKRVCLALSLIGWMLVILNLIGWFWALLLNRLCSIVVPLWVPVFFWCVIDDPSPGTAPDTARCAAEGGLGPAPETQTDSTDARHRHRTHIQTHKHTDETSYGQDHSRFPGNLRTMLEDFLFPLSASVYHSAFIHLFVLTS